MNTLELKNKICIKIDNLNDADFEKVYNQLLEVLEKAPLYKLSVGENEAIDAALKASEKGKTYSHEEVMNEAKDKFPHLKFK